ncbi:MAG: hypothetical protein NT104_07035 [Bacteroidetes bacterium]|nr:hypothetical protein [Bacteroidota bacterium]
MKPIIVFFTVVLFQVFGLTAYGQNKVVLEQIQTYSTINPAASYWHLPADIQPILEAFDSGLFASLQMQRETSITPMIKELKKQNQLGKIVVDWTRSREYPFHAYLELYELNPELIYRNKWINLPQTKRDSIHSIWYIACNIYNQKQEKVFGKTMLIGILPIHSLGMGYEISTTGSLPSNLYQGIAKAIGYISPKMDNMEYMEAKMPTAYATDDFWMPLIHNRPRILFDTAKQFMSYINNGFTHLLRIPEAVLKNINLKDRSPNNPFKDISEIIRKSRAGINYKEYYQVLQPLRDVHEDIDYTLEAYIEFNNEVVNDEHGKKYGIEFLKDSIHKIYQDKNEIGGFVVKENVLELSKYFYPDRVYNGYDSTKAFALGTFYAKQLILQASVIEGKVLGHNFSIKINLETNLKTISLDNKIIMVVHGDKKPSQMVLVENNTPAHLMNLLLLIAFSEIFQSPS